MVCLRSFCPLTRCSVNTLLLILSAVAVAASSGRPVQSLDGTWNFKIDPSDSGVQGQWYLPEFRFADKIQVPGAWDAQGYGSATDKLHHNYVGKAWYKRHIRIPRKWDGKRVFLCVGGVHRYAKLWINDRYLGEHIGYLSPFEIEITNYISPGEQAALTICVDSEQRWEIDGLIGCFDLIDAMFTNWGGIWGHVRLEARNEAWLYDLFVKPTISPTACTVTASLTGKTESADHVQLEILSTNHRRVAIKTVSLRDAINPRGELELKIDIPNGNLWSPSSPNLYVARMSVLTGNRIIDSLETRFGLREIEIRNCHFYLNGKKLFLAGYGDDAIYPKTMVAPSDKRYYLKRLKTIKRYGFNFVRHHSHFLPPEYYEACDEIGMLVSSELPIAYESYYHKTGEPGIELYKTEWAEAIRRFRNHPSIFDWCMSNEMWDSFPIAPDLYRIAKELDPTRPVIDSDGLLDGLHRQTGFLNGTHDRDTLDYYTIQFDVHALPLDNLAKHRFTGVPKKPVVSHETGNYLTFPRLDQIESFQHNIKPFWLIPTKQKLDALGLLHESNLWAENSENLYYLCHKLNIEDLRKNPNISGYNWWLFQDYWTGSNGLFDTYFHPKSITPEAVRKFIGEIVLLQDGLQLTYPSQESLDMRLLVSNYSTESLEKASVHWKAMLGTRLLEKGDLRIDVSQGEIDHAANVRCTLPDVDSPQKVMIHAELSTGNRTVRNDWYTWVYPKEIQAPELEIPVYASDEILPFLSRFRAKSITEADSSVSSAIYVVRDLDRRILDSLENGACVICLCACNTFEAHAAKFKTGWWLGNKCDSNAGTVVYDHPITQATAPDGWCDLGWYRLLEGALDYILDDLPSTPDVLVRALDIPSLCRNKALLFQAKVGKGCLIASGFNFRFSLDFEAKAIFPESDWLLTQLVNYAGSLPQPKAELPVSYLRDRVPEKTLRLERPYLSGFSQLIEHKGEIKKTYPTYKETKAPMYICRQMEPGHYIQWDTAPVPEKLVGGNVTFVFAGGFSRVPEPKKEGFVLQLNDLQSVDFDATREYRVWQSENEKLTLFFIPRKLMESDALGYYCVNVSPDLLTAGQPCRLTVRSKSEGTARWFGLNLFNPLSKEEN
ncbi:MAG: sugar-binding domain-containing protein [bacterium]